jgi:threonine dehydratase
MPKKSLRPTNKQMAMAAEVIARHLQPTPLTKEHKLSKILDTGIFIKQEFLNPVKSFKIRGALYLVHETARRRVASGLLTASTGNHGAAMAFACQKYNFPLAVCVPENAGRSKIALIRQFGAKMESFGRDFDETKALIQQRNLPPGTVFIEDGSCPEIVAGTATMGLEIVRDLPEVEVVVVPVGNGALIGGIGAALKDFNPAIRVIGVQSEAAPCMAMSFHAGHPINTEHCDTFAGGIAVRVAIPEAVTLMREVVDEMLLVSETELKQAMGMFYCLTGTMLEGAGAAPLAGGLKIKNLLKNKKVCLIASGANIDEALRQEIMEHY